MGTTIVRLQHWLSSDTSMRQSKILVCDDDAMIVQIVVSKLRSDGYDVGSVASGRDLFQRMRAEVPDLVVIDPTMPGMDGGAVVETIRAIGRLRNLPIMMLSAKRDPGFVRCMVKAGVTDYLTKPFALQELSTRVRKILGSEGSDTLVID